MDATLVRRYLARKLAAGLEPDALLDIARDVAYEHVRRTVAGYGAEAGKNAATWVFDGNTAEAAYRRVLQGITDGDPEILDDLPTANLSGEWADDPAIECLARDAGWPAYDPDQATADEAEAISEFGDAYTEAYDSAVMLETERLARQALAGIWAPPVPRLDTGQPVHRDEGTPAPGHIH